jgi:predicted nuclease of predicted toxin-antitoxin system
MKKYDEVFMKFLADMGISPRTVNWLKNRGYDAVHLVEEGLERLPDDEILVKARKEGRILLTVDLDFGYLLAVSGAELPSVILFRLGNESYQIIQERLTELLSLCGGDLAAGAIISVTDEAFRVRRLPI